MESSSTPRFSFVIPAFNEEQFIHRTLAQIFHLMADAPQFEVIVVDNHSSDATAELATRAGDVELIRLPSKTTVAKARNIGWTSSAADVVIFLDADIILTEEWKTKFLESLPQLSHEKMITGATVSISEAPGFIERNWFYYMDTSARKYINSANLITNKKVLSAIGGFREELVTGEDVDFSNRARMAGCDVILDPAYKVHHEGYPKTLGQFTRREMWHGIGDIQTLRSFVESRVAQIAFLHASLLFIGIVSSLMTREILPLILMLLLLSAGDLLISSRKFRTAPPLVKANNAFLYFLYFISRFLSTFKRR